MPEKFSALGGGTGHQFPIKGFGRQKSSNRDTYDFAYKQANRYRVDWVEDFIGDLSAADIGGTGHLYDLSAAGTPTQAVVANGAHGQLQVKLTNDNQQSVIGYDWADQLIIPAASYPFFEMRFGFRVLPTTAEYAMFGLISAFAGNPITQWSTLAHRLVFRLNASGLLYANVDDATTDSGLVSTGQTLVVDTWYTIALFAQPNGKVKFWLADQYGSNEVLGAEISGAALNALTTNLQVVAWLQKDSGTTTPDMRIDYLRASWNRVTTAIA